MTYHLGSIEPDQRAELFADARGEEPRAGTRRVLMTAVALLVMGLFAGGLWFAYVQGTRHAGGEGGNSEVPLIRADPRATKVKPEHPGGMEIPDRDKLIYSPNRTVVEHLLPPPEKPMPRPAPPPAPAAAAPAATAPTAPAGPAAGPVTAAGAPASAARPQQQAAAPAKPPPAAAKPAAANSPQTKSGSIRLQFGSLPDEASARQEWDRLKRRNSDLLGALSATPVRADLGDKGIHYRIQTGSVADPASAERICAELKQRSIACIIIR
jgi:hypothetical protein